MNILYLKKFTIVGCLGLMFFSAFLSAQSNHSFLGGIVSKGSVSEVMSISILPNAPFSQVGRAYNKPVGDSGIMRDVMSKISPVIPLGELGIGGAIKAAQNMTGGGVGIFIPQINYGFSGSLSGENVCISYKKKDHKCDNDSVIIEKYTTFILKGSYHSEEVSGTFFIVQPWRGDSSFTIPVEDILEKGGLDIKVFASSYGIDINIENMLKKMRKKLKTRKISKPSKGRSSSGSVRSPVIPPTIDINAFLITTDSQNNACFENMNQDKNQKLNDKYWKGMKVFSKSSNSIIAKVDMCPQPSLAKCDDTDDIRQFFYEKAKTDGNKNLEHSRNSCERKGGKWSAAN